jgi:hypothetical protein
MQIPTLSNRSVALVILALFAVAAYWGIRYVFFLNIGTLRFEVTDGSSYSVVLKRATIEVGRLDCTESCTFADLPAGPYQYVATSPERLASSGEARVGRGEITLVKLHSEVEVKTTAALPVAESSGKYKVLSDPVRLVDGSQDNLELIASASAIGYSLDSMPFGYFLTFDANRVITAYELATKKTRLISWTLPEMPTRLKRLANGKSFVLYTKENAYLYDLDTGGMEPIGSYDDIEASPAGTMIALIRDKSAEKKKFFNLQDASGDLLLDISRIGVPKTLRANVADVRMLYWDGSFGVHHSDGSRQLLNIK